MITGLATAALLGVATPVPAQPPGAPPSPAAEAAARDVQDRAAVNALTSGHARDQAIASAARDRLAGDPRLRGADVSVNVHEGVVSLTGSVRSQEQAAAAVTLAGRADGVMRVDDHLSVPEQ